MTTPGVPDADPRYLPSDVPLGRSGDWIVERFEVQVSPGYDPKRDHRPAFAKRRPGRYTLLRRGDVQFMTDLYEEWWTQRIAVEEAWQRGGEVLISGLGLGLLVESLLGPPASPVRGVTVLERSPEVIRLSGPHLEARYGDRLRIVAADAFAWDPPAGARYAVGWHDIWPEPYGARVSAEMRRLEERFHAACDWQGSWPREYRAEFATDETGR